MKSEKTDRSIAGMAVLKDIRGLLSVTREKAPPTETSPKAESAVDAEKTALQKQLSQYEELVRTQQATLDKLEAEKKDLAAKVSALQSAANKPAPRQAGNDRLSNEVAGLESQKADLTAALASIEELLQYKTKELARRLANLYQEAGDNRAAGDFRRITSQLEASGNFGEFLRGLLQQ